MVGNHLEILAGWSAGCLLRWLVGWLAGWLVELVGWLVGWLASLGKEEGSINDIFICK